MLKKMVHYLSLLTILIGPSIALANDFLLGVGVHPQSFPGGAESLFRQIERLHAQSIRTDYPWYQVEGSKGVYTVPNKEIEDTLNKAIDKNITPIIILGYGNPIYNEKTKNNPRMKPIGEKSVAGFVNYATWASNHFADKDVIFEIWNEWVQGGGGGKKITLSDASLRSYSNLINKTCFAIKNNNRNAKVIIGSTSPFDNKSNFWLRSLITNLDMKCVDGISLHAYHYFPKRKTINAESVVKELDELQNYLHGSGSGKDGIPIPFYITEIGVPGISSARYNDSDIADYFERLIPLLKSKSYIKGVWWYDLIDDGDNKDNIEHNFGLLNVNKMDKPVVNKFISMAKGL
ncbi:glycosyl hydrolase [Erwinia sp. INIA-01]|uniref:glycosyl hydrolase n=1 Tax=Erwinia sp. INIA01 TaxID=2991500 RepID=UPI0022259B1B|nr:glycosyl hydrolase [Erwinia sp. INIA01]MCW1874109.1 glycosyl hydrolase [Erwinia sp. INIA01]